MKDRHKRISSESAFLVYNAILRNIDFENFSLLYARHFTLNKSPLPVLTGKTFFYGENFSRTGKRSQFVRRLYV